MGCGRSPATANVPWRHAVRLIRGRLRPRLHASLCSLNSGVIQKSLCVCVCVCGLLAAAAVATAAVAAAAAGSWWFGLELNHPDQPAGLATPRPRVEAVLALVSCCHARAVCPGCQLAPSVDPAIFILSSTPLGCGRSPATANVPWRHAVRPIRGHSCPRLHVAVLLCTRCHPKEKGLTA